MQKTRLAVNADGSAVMPELVTELPQGPPSRQMARSDAVAKMFTSVTERFIMPRRARRDMARKFGKKAFKEANNAG